MSKASEYAKAIVTARESRPPIFVNPGKRGEPAEQIACLQDNGNMLLLKSVQTVDDPLAFARWIVETWGEDDPIAAQADAAYGRAKQKCLHVSPTGEITGTLPCGHGVAGIRWGDVATNMPSVPYCLECAKDPAP